MKIIGLTGSIGMGKSTTARMFADEGVPVFDADAAVHALYASGEEGAAAVSLIFPEALGEDGSVDRAALGRAVLHDPDAMRKLEAIVHPLVAARQQEFLQRAREAGADAVVLDIPLLFEKGGSERVDLIVVASAPPALQRQRVMERPGMTDQRFEAILAQQTPDAEKRARADFVIDTSGGFDAAREQVRTFLRRLREGAFDHDGPRPPRNRV